MANIQNITRGDFMGLSLFLQDFIMHYAPSSLQKMIAQELTFKISVCCAHLWSIKIFFGFFFDIKLGNHINVS